MSGYDDQRLHRLARLMYISALSWMSAPPEVNWDTLEQELRELWYRRAQAFAKHLAELLEVEFINPLLGETIQARKDVMDAHHSVELLREKQAGLLASIRRWLRVDE